MPPRGRKCARVISWIPLAGQVISLAPRRGGDLPSLRSSTSPTACRGGFRSLRSRYPLPLAGAALANGRRQLMALQAILAVPVSNPYESELSTGRKRKQPVAQATSCLSHLRKKGESNPRYPVTGIPVFETSAFSHSAILPLGTAKIIQIIRIIKRTDANPLSCRAVSIRSRSTAGCRSRAL